MRIRGFGDFDGFRQFWRFLPKNRGTPSYLRSPGPHSSGCCCNALFVCKRLHRGVSGKICCEICPKSVRNLSATPMATLEYKARSQSGQSEYSASLESSGLGATIQASALSSSKSERTMTRFPPLCSFRNLEDNEQFSAFPSCNTALPF
jgi:hypothetical protein